MVPYPMLFLDSWVTTACTHAYMYTTTLLKAGSGYFGKRTTCAILSGSNASSKRD